MTGNIPLLIGVASAVLAAGLFALWWFSSRRRRPPVGLLDMEPEEPAIPAEKPREPVLRADQEPASRKSEALVDEPGGLLDRLFKGLARTRQALAAQLDTVFNRTVIDDAFFQELEEALIVADVGVRAAASILASLREDVRRERLTDPQAIRRLLKNRLVEMLTRGNAELAAKPPGEPLVILVVGVNGGGKTTTIGKLAARYGWEGKKVLLGAGDTYRAGAIEQLRIWAERSGADIVARDEGADPASVLFDALQAARSRNCDVVICDTAGRLQNRKPLMDQLGKVMRVIRKASPDAPHEVLLVLDATIGQNALSQARIFGEVVGVTGLVVTKLDGTAKGGVVVAVCEETGLPVKLIGVGEKVDDLRPFEPEKFIDALLDTSRQAPG